MKSYKVQLRLDDVELGSGWSQLESNDVCWKSFLQVTWRKKGILKTNLTRDVEMTGGRVEAIVSLHMTKI